MPCPLLFFSLSDYLSQTVDTNSNTEWQAVQIQISWLLQKPTDLDLYCLQRQDISGFSRTRVNTGKNKHVFISKVHFQVIKGWSLIEVASKSGLTVKFIVLLLTSYLISWFISCGWKHTSKVTSMPGVM